MEFVTSHIFFYIMYKKRTKVAARQGLGRLCYLGPGGRWCFNTLIGALSARPTGVITQQHVVHYGAPTGTR